MVDNMPDLFDIAEGMKRRDAGIQQAIDNTEKEDLTWGSRALGFVIKFPGQRFMTEDIRIFAYENGFQRPVHERAWGSVMLTAQRKGLIISDGIGLVKNVKAHRTPATIWKKI